MQLIAQLKCVYTDECSMVNKQKKSVHIENYDLIVITEMWWDESHSWKTEVEGYKIFRSHGRKSGCVAFYVKKCIGCKELPLRNSHKQIELVGKRAIKDQTNKEHLVVGVYYRPPDQGKPVDKALLQLQESLFSHVLILLGDFNHPDVHWEKNTAGRKQSRRPLECIKDKFLVQVLTINHRRSVTGPPAHQCGQTH